MKAAGSCALVLSMLAAHGGISDAVGASAPLLSATPISPFSAASQSPRKPAGATVPDGPAGTPRNPNLMPIPAPAPTNHFAGAAENSASIDQLAVLSGSRRSISFLTTP